MGSAGAAGAARALSRKNIIFMAPDSENTASSGWSRPCRSVYTTCIRTTQLHSMTRAHCAVSFSADPAKPLPQARASACQAALPQAHAGWQPPAGGWTVGSECRRGPPETARPAAATAWLRARRARAPRLLRAVLPEGCGLRRDDRRIVRADLVVADAARPCAHIHLVHEQLHRLQACRAAATH